MKSFPSIELKVSVFEVNLLRFERSQISLDPTSTPPRTVRGPLPKMAYLRTAGMFS